jgi:hypothetical protein
MVYDEFKSWKETKMNNEFDYYAIFPKITEGVPILMNNDAIDPKGTFFLAKDKYAEDIKTPVQ